MMTAASAVPSTMAGSSRCRKLCTGSSNSDTKPDAGRIGNAIANTSTSISPNQKFGTDSPSSATEFAAHSVAVRRRTAATTPDPTPMSTAITIANMASCRVTGSACPIVERTGSPVRADRPRSPVSALSTYRAYCTGSGRSSR